MYSDLFTCWADVQASYNMNEPEPEHIFIAHYEYESYSGDSLVVYYNNGKYYLESGGHCSCYGLEDSWNPVEYDSKEEFIECLEKSLWRNKHVIEMVRTFSRSMDIRPASRLEI